jgi:hypothetical protein
VRVLGFLLFPSGSIWVLKRFSKLFPIVAPSFFPYLKTLGSTLQNLYVQAKGGDYNISILRMSKD